MAEIKPAATIKVIRELPEGGIEVLLLRRNKKLKFAPRYWVFPGGKIEPHEIDSTSSMMEAALIAAVRETKEEADIDVEKENLKFFVEWTTPEPQPYRYKTYFFHAQVPFESEVKVDDSEILEYRWYTPEDALKATLEDDLILLPPTYLSLMRIRNCKDYKSVVEEWGRAKPHIVLPRVVSDSGMMHILYEGDAGYLEGKHDIPGSRHRLVADYTKGDFTFVHEDCEDYFPISGGHHN